MYYKKFLLIVAVLFSLLFVSACKDEDSPLESHDDEHFDAVGIIFESSGIKIGEIFKGVTTDTLYVDANDMTPHIEVTFYDEDRDVLQAPEDEDFSFGGESADTNIVQIWQHPGEEGEFEFHLDGKNAGVTNVEFFIFHGDHKDFISGTIPVRVR